jgi:hypothetical protein
VSCRKSAICGTFFNKRYAMKKPILFILFISIATISKGQEMDTVFKKIILSDVNLLEMRASERTPMTVLDLSNKSLPSEIRGNTL